MRLLFSVAPRKTVAFLQSTLATFVPDGRNRASGLVAKYPASSSLFFCMLVNLAGGQCRLAAPLGIPSPSDSLLLRIAKFSSADHITRAIDRSLVDDREPIQTLQADGWRDRGTAFLFSISKDPNDSSSCQTAGRCIQADAAFAAPMEYPNALYPRRRLSNTRASIEIDEST